MVVWEQVPADSAASRMFIGFSANRLTGLLSERVLLIIGSAQPFGDQRGFVTALDFHGREPGDFHASFYIFNGLKRESSADAGAGRDGSGEAQTVEAVVDAEFHVAGYLDRLREQHR